VGIASGLGVARDIAMNLASSLNFISSDYLDLDAPVRKQFEDAYNAYHQKATQELVDRMARGRIEKALISKFKETPNQCSPVEIEKANALIAKRANRKRKRTDDMLETEEQNVEKRRKAEATRHQTHRLRSRINHISGVLGAGGGELVKKALALDNKSLVDVSDEELNAVIKSLQSVAQGRKARKANKTMSAEEESKLAEKARLHNEQCAKMYEEARNSTSNTFSKKTGMWSQPLPLRGEGGRAWSENEIDIIMSMKMNGT
jgi:hypothetical protein